jgi:hypothetical protein
MPSVPPKETPRTKTRRPDLDSSRQPGLRASPRFGSASKALNEDPKLAGHNSTDATLVGCRIGGL